MTEVTMAGGLVVTAVVVILITTILVIITKAFPSNRSRDSSDGGGVAVPVIPDTSSIVTPSSSSPPGCWKYDVFLSFRGEDTRKTFVDHLYSALQQHGIILTYKDDETLDRGDTIAPALMKAIETSQIALVIFSENYANSSWCLDELSHIMKCRDRETGQIVFPIFYHVDPSDVRKQKGKFGKAFAKHNKKKKVESWRKALVDASNIAGWEPNQVANGHEAKCIQKIVGSIFDKLSSLDSTVEDENLVGMGIRLEQLKFQLKIGLGGVHMIGIWGLGGGGKTTLATSLYMKCSPNFDSCCFLGNIREETKQHGLQSLQEKVLLAVVGTKMQVESVDIGKHTIKRMLCRRNVLIVLDDVDHLEQLEALAGRHDWFGNGSRIIITTRDEQVLKSHRVDEVCPVTLLSHDEAIHLFKRHAYQEHNPVEDYEKLSLRVISYVNGLPLALKILGSFLYGKDKDEWLSTLARLKDHPEMDIVEKLKISYDGLKHVEKELFLDIACFFRRPHRYNIMEMLDACGFHPGIGIKVLIQKTLISVSKHGYFEMHDLVQEMAHYIVRGEHPNHPEKHSRVWRKEDIEDMCSRNATTVNENDKIEAISCHGFFSSNFIMLVSNMKKLRFLHVNDMGMRIYDEGPSFLSNELRYMRWDYYPASPFPETFQPKKLHVLSISRSLQKVLWEGCKYLPCLKELELWYMEALVRTPDFGGLPCLEKLILKGCESLEEIPPSLGNHSSLVFVFVSFCEKLRRFPRIVGMKKLEILRISNCKALVEFPLRIEGKMDKLVELYLGEVGIEGNFPRFLRKLTLNGCGLKDGEIPTEIGELFSLQELCLKANDFTRLDFSLSRLTRLKLLQLSDCEKLVELPELPSSLAILEADDCHSLEGVMRDEIHKNCKRLSQVSIRGGGNNIKGVERLLETMLLQGNDGVESRCVILEVDGLEIARGFERRIYGLVKRRRCGMQLPENWSNDFSGFQICLAISYYSFEKGIEIIMKHEEDVSVDDDDGIREWYTKVGYIPFSLLREKLWWDPTSTAIYINRYGIIGLKLVPKRGDGGEETSAQMETTTHPSSSSQISLDDDDDHPYNCRFKILHDSKSDLKCRIEPNYSHLDNLWY